MTATALQVIVTLATTLSILYAVTPLNISTMVVIGLGAALSSTGRLGYRRAPGGFDDV